MGQSSSRRASSSSEQRQSDQLSPMAHRASRTLSDSSTPDSRPSSRFARPPANILLFLSRLRSGRSDPSSPEALAAVSRNRSRRTRDSSISTILGRRRLTRSRRHRLSSPTQALYSSLDSPGPTLPPQLQMPSFDESATDPLGHAWPSVMGPLPLPGRGVNTERQTDLHPPNTILDRVTTRTMAPDNNMRNSLRRQRPPLNPNEDNAAMLSRLLSVAAAATAATLMGDDHRTGTEARSFVGEDEDGTFDGFLHSLQNGRIASALRGHATDNGDDAGDPGPPAPLNFFRMFRFGSSAATRRASDAAMSHSGHVEPDDASRAQRADGDSSENRMVPIIIVGIRSINPSITGAAQHDENIPPFLDALSSFPTPVASGPEPSIDGLLQPPQNGTTFSHRRRASMGGISTFPSTYDNQRHQRGTTVERPRPFSALSDTTVSPRPPPSTPSGLSAFSSGATSPTPTPPLDVSPLSSASSSRHDSFVRSPFRGASGLETTTEESQSLHEHGAVRQRPLSESDHTRFGAGSSRRNGMVEPDHAPGEGPRSWIIYVLGGSYPENHPILTTPSLFTDAPTYEDMMLLSTLLGPAKPPVASESDVSSAGGLYTVREGSHVDAGYRRLVATATEGEETIVITPDQRCLVCLGEYQPDEEARRLRKCSHLFHRECIDQWLTTGRNSCPLCRGQGVDEHDKRPSGSMTPDMAPVV